MFFIDDVNHRQVNASQDLECTLEQTNELGFVFAHDRKLLLTTDWNKVGVSNVTEILGIYRAWIIVRHAYPW